MWSPTSDIYPWPAIKTSVIQTRGVFILKFNTYVQQIQTRGVYLFWNLTHICIANVVLIQLKLSIQDYQELKPRSVKVTNYGQENKSKFLKI